MTTPMSRESMSTRLGSVLPRSRDEQRDYLRAADRVDADGYADFDRARHDGSYVHLHDDECSDGIGGAEAVYRDRQFRDHGDPVLYPRRKFSDPRWGRAPHDQFRDLHGRALVRRTWACRCHGLRAVRGCLGIVTRDGHRHRLDHAASDGAAGFPQALRCRRDGDLRGPPDPYPPLDRY